MKNKAVTRILKQVARALASVTKAKSLALSLKSKMSDIRARVTIFSLLYLDRRSLLGSIRPNKFRTFLPHHHKLRQEPSCVGEDEYQISNQSNMVLSCSSNIAQDATVTNHVNTEYLEVEEDLIEALLEEMVFEDHDEGKSAIGLVKNYDEIGDGEDFRLEDRIDEAAELFIKRFHQQIRMQKQNSFKS